ncbi:MAG TPA: trypsin-like peptidase domain-containing protein [Burkholderiales bacterium]|nr:trypsin-like peptidase domain-containing protein [Burkholderiales bacterium]
MRKRGAVYSSSRRLPVAATPVAPGPTAPAAPTPTAPAAKPAGAKPPVKQARRRRWTLPAVAAALLIGCAAWLLVPSAPPPEFVAEEPPQKEMTAADAYEKIRGSVVMVRGSPYDGTEEVETKGSDSTGTGVVIVDTGIILTNLHVVDGAKRIRVVFADGMEAVADLVGARPEHDLAVLKAQTVPDDLEPATMRSTVGLRPGEPVVAVGFPFGIGPSASAGVISGLGREYRSAEGKRILTNLIQFDAAVNPGNSGGPLVTNEGEVIGIVTGLLNPTEQRVFVGIGFAVPIENAAAAAGLPPF